MEARGVSRMGADVVAPMIQKGHSKNSTRKQKLHCHRQLENSGLPQKWDTFSDRPIRLWHLLGYTRMRFFQHWQGNAGKRQHTSLMGWDPLFKQIPLRAGTDGRGMSQVPSLTDGHLHTQTQQPVPPSKQKNQGAYTFTGSQPSSQGTKQDRRRISSLFFFL